MDSDFIISDSVLKEYKGDGGDVVIPYGVTKLDYEAFRFCDGLKTVYIPDSVTSISASVFSNCTNLTSVTDPGSVRTLGFGAFRACDSLESVTLMDGVEELGGDTFFGCEALKSVVIPKSVKKIWDGPLGDFVGCDSVTVVCPEDSYAHKFCIENDLHFIFDYQYSTFKGLAPQHVEKVSSPFPADEEKPFIFISYSHNDSDRIFVIIKRLYEAGWKIWYDEGLTIGESYDEVLEKHVAECSVFLLFVTKNSQKSKYIGKNEVPWGIKYRKPVIKCILDEGTDIPVDGELEPVTVTLDEAEHALENTEGLVKGSERVARGIVVSFNPQNRLISSFYASTSSTSEKPYAYGLYSDEGANRARSILYEARENGCRIYDGILEGEDPALLKTSPCLIVFLDNAFLRDSHLVKILSDAFREKRDLAVCSIGKVTLPEELEGLHDIHWLNYLRDEDDVMNAHLAGYLQERGCRSEDVLPGFSYETVGDNIILTEYHGTRTDPVIEPEYNGRFVISIDDEAFKNCKNLKSIVLPDSVKRIGEKAFEGCTGLEKVVLSNQIELISTNAFFGCTALTDVKLPESLKMIGDYAFEGCTALTSIELPCQTENIGYRAFCECVSLTAIKIPDSVKHIDEWAFMGCTGLSSLDLGNGIKEIEWGCFDGCSSLRSVVIPGSIPKVYGFTNCESLNEVRFSHGVKTIGAVSFERCKNLREVIIPKSVTEIEGCAFKGCESLTEITIHPGVRKIDPSTFEGCPNLTIICLRDSAAHQYGEENGIKVRLVDSLNTAGEDEDNSDHSCIKQPDQRTADNRSEKKGGFFSRLFGKGKATEDPSHDASSKQGSQRKHKKSREEKEKELFYRLTGELFENGIFKKVLELERDMGCVVNASDSIYLLFFYKYAAEKDIEELLGFIIPKGRITKAADDTFSLYKYVYDNIYDCKKLYMTEQLIEHLKRKKAFTDKNGPDLNNIDPDAEEKLLAQSQ